MKISNHTPLLMIIVIVSMLGASFLSVIGAQGVYHKYNTEGWSQPAIFVLMRGLSDHTYPWNAKNEERIDPSDIQPDTTEDKEPEEDIAQSDTDNKTEDNPDKSTESNTEQQPDTESTVQEKTETYEFTEVSKDYFDDALFIGDSRVTGVQLYSGWDNVTYYAEEGLTIYNMFDREIVEENGKKISVENALKKHSFGKIYLEIGINEMGTGTIDSFMKAYEGAVTHLRELQPDAIIFVCGIMYVKQSRSETDSIFNNTNIQKRNDRIAQLADQKNIFYLDINEIVADEKGNLNPDYTWDEVHLLGKYDVLWMEYFSKHGIVKDI